jgi:hypothetical protein
VAVPFEIPYGGAYAGLDVQTPEIFLDSSATPSTNNFWFRNKELRSTPPFVKIFPGPDGNNPPLGQNTFRDTNGQLHTCSFTTRGLFQLNATNTPAGVNPWTLVGTSALLSGTPVSSRSFANQIYYTNGTANLYTWDGLTDTPSNVTNLISSFGGTSPAPSTVGGYYLYEINNQLCLLNVVLFTANGFGSIAANTTLSFPQRIWWSANGVPNQWDPAVNTSAGFNDFLDVPDLLTGVIAMGEIAYIFRNNGITQQTITGNSLEPFYFDHLWSSEYGIGNVYPWSISQYGSVGFFVATDNVYQMSVNNFAPIGGNARDAIMADLALSVSNPTGTVVPNFAYGYIFLTYKLSIPQKNQTRIYFYSIEDKNWGMETIPNIHVTGRPSVCWR